MISIRKIRICISICSQLGGKVLITFFSLIKQLFIMTFFCAYYKKKGKSWLLGEVKETFFLLANNRECKKTELKIKELL